MRDIYKLCLVLVVIAVLLLVVIVASDAYHRDQARKLENKSGGNLDETARKAINHTRAIGRRNYEDNWRQARILRYNFTNNFTNDDYNAIAAAHEAAEYYITAMVLAPDQATLADFLQLRFEAGDIMGLPPAQKLAALDDRANRVEAVQEYVEEVTRPTDDPQNVHDSTLNDGLRKTFAEICAGPAPNSEEVLQAVYAYLTKFGDKTRADTIQTLDKMAENNYVSTFNAREADILARVWVASAEKDNVILALAESSETGSTSCANGRIGRLINSLYYTGSVTAPPALTTKAYRDMIFIETNQIYQNIINTAAPKYEQVVKEYRGEKITNLGPEIDDLRAEMRQILTEAITANVNAYADRIPANKLNSILAEALVIVD